MNARSALLLAWFASSPMRGDEAPPPVTGNREAAKLDLANSDVGSIPGGASVVKGRWSVDGGKRLEAAPEPLLDNWLEFGPEVREKPATILAAGSAPGGTTLRSRFGVGLYGKNGVQLRFVAGRGELELVRRGEVLATVTFAAKADDLIHLELTATTERGNWRFVGRAWTEGAERPGTPIIEHQLFAAELLFPVAGRAVLFATPFSGDPVEYHEATLYHGTYEPVVKDRPEEKPEAAEKKK